MNVPSARPTADVAVVIPVKNRAEPLQDALLSVQEQTLQPKQVIVVDDGSDDASPEVAERLGATVVRLPQSGGSGPARNAGIRAADATWVAFLDSDDAWSPDHLEHLMAHAEEHLVLLTTTARATTGGYIGNVSTEQVPLDSARCFAPNPIVVTSGALVRRQALLDAGLFRALPRAQDLDLWARVLEHGPGLALTRPTVVYRQRGTYTTLDGDHRERENLMRVLTDLEDRPWMTSELRRCVLARTEWDWLRLAQHEHRWRDVARHAAWFAVHPQACPQLLRVLDMRKQGRAREAAELTAA